MLGVSHTGRQARMETGYKAVDSRDPRYHPEGRHRQACPLLSKMHPSPHFPHPLPPGMQEVAPHGSPAVAAFWRNKMVVKADAASRARLRRWKLLSPSRPRLAASCMHIATHSHCMKTCMQPKCMLTALAKCNASCCVAGSCFSPVCSQGGLVTSVAHNACLAVN